MVGTGAVATLFSGTLKGGNNGVRVNISSTAVSTGNLTVHFTNPDGTLSAALTTAPVAQPLVIGSQSFTVTPGQPMKDFVIRSQFGVGVATTLDIDVLNQMGV
tara:strand:+ start:6229 stop:6537 length:309 start_codon:yes stop_codon:yes gene_type:complete